MAREKALFRLNYRRPEHPPDVYYIRRDPNLVKRYLNQRDFEDLINRAQPSHKYNYRFFGLSPEDVDFKARLNKIQVPDSFTKLSRHAKSMMRNKSSKEEIVEEKFSAGFTFPIQKVKTTDEILKKLGKKESSNLKGKIVSRMNLSDPSIERLIGQQNFWIQEGSPLPSERENGNSKVGIP